MHNQKERNNQKQQKKEKKKENIRYKLQE